MERDGISVRLGVVDFLGIALPGLVWALLTISLSEVLGWTTIASDPWPITVAVALIHGSESGKTENTNSSPIYVSFVVLGLLMGYVQRSLGNDIVEKISRAHEQLLLRLRSRRKRPKSDIQSVLRSHRFPYDATHEGHEYHDRLQELVKKVFGPDNSQLGEQPFSGCRRLLRLPALTGELLLEHRARQAHKDQQKDQRIHQRPGDLVERRKVAGVAHVKEMAQQQHTADGKIRGTYIRTEEVEAVSGTETPESTIKIQVGGVPGTGQVSPEMSTEDFIDATKDRLASIGDTIANAIQPFFDTLSTLEVKPSECAIEFGVNAGGEAGVPFVTKGTVGANFKVSLKWDWRESS
jgi:hypothetical protein